MMTSKIVFTFRKLWGYRGAHDPGESFCMGRFAGLMGLKSWDPSTGRDSSNTASMPWGPEQLLPGA